MGRLNIGQLEKLLEDVDSRLSGLAAYNLRSGVGAIGFRSRAHANADEPEWLEIELAKVHSIDEVVLVPTILRQQSTGFAPDAFPSDFRIVIGEGKGEDRIVNGTFPITHDSSNRIAPLMVPVKKTQGSWVRIECDAMPTRLWDNQHIFQLAEVLVFEGEDNLAENRPVTASSNEPTRSPSWDKSYVVDGFVPYLMNSPQGNGSPALVSVVDSNEATLVIDLGSKFAVSLVRFHLVDQADTVPQTFSGDFGLPGTLRIEGALDDEFSDPILLSEWIHQTPFDSGPIKSFRFAPQDCRFIRITGVEPYQFYLKDQLEKRFGFAEIEVFAKGVNVSVGKKVTSSGMTAVGSVDAITDGENRYGKILPMRTWLAELAERYELESSRPLIAGELNRKYGDQNQIVRWLTGLAGALVVLVLGTALYGRIKRRQAVRQTRERIAADIHDELGANLHAIGLVSDLARTSHAQPERLDSLLVRIQNLSQKSADVARKYTSALESESEINLLEELHRNVRITSDLKHRLDFGCDESDFPKLTNRQKLGLVLFHKECLTNTIRHSNATSVDSKLFVEGGQLVIEVWDDGDSESVKTVPHSLSRRAKLLGGKVALFERGGGGTGVSIRIGGRQGLLQRILYQD